MLDRLTDIIALSSLLNSEPHVKKLEPDGSKTNASTPLEYVCVCTHIYECICGCGIVHMEELLLYLFYYVKFQTYTK